jgi:hypothetical protein
VIGASSQAFGRAADLVHPCARGQPDHRVAVYDVHGFVPDGQDGRIVLDRPVAQQESKQITLVLIPGARPARKRTVVVEHDAVAGLQAR